MLYYDFCYRDYISSHHKAENDGLSIVLFILKRIDYVFSNINCIY